MRVTGTLACCLACLQECSGFLALLPTRAALARAPALRTSAAALSTAAARSAGASRGITMRFVVKYTFKVKIGREERFEEYWTERELQLDGVTGFTSFMLLRGEDDFDEAQEEGGRSGKDGYATYEALSTWMHRMDWDDWRTSTSTSTTGEGGAQDRKRGPLGLREKDVTEYLLEAPDQRVYETTIVLPLPAEEQGGLWDWEENADYFDGDIVE